MNATDEAAPIDLERIAVTARSVLYNLDVLAEEGLSPDGISRARDWAEHLVTAESRSVAEVRERAASLRQLLGEPSGPTSAVLRAWLDDGMAPGE